MNGQTRPFKAFCDASLKPRSEATCAIVIMPKGTKKIKTLALANLGRLKRIEQAETTAMIFAMHVAPALGLHTVYNDNTFAVDALKDFRAGTLSDRQKRHDLSVSKIPLLKSGLAKQSGVILTRIPRQTDAIKLADRFSRKARGWPKDTVRTIDVPDSVRIEDQIDYLMARIPAA